jgi:hypothetical protein
VGPPLPLALRRRVICPLLSIFYALSEWNVSVGSARLPLSLGLGYALGTYWLIAISALLRAVQYEHPRQWFWVLFFYCAAPIYVSLNFALVVISAVKIYSGRAGGWVVTRRSAVGAAGGGSSEARAHLTPEGAGMKKVPTWLAMNSFATGRFNQLDDTLPAEDVPREDSQMLAGGQLEFTLGWSSRTPSATPSKTNVLL